MILINPAFSLMGRNILNAEIRSRQGLFIKELALIQRFIDVK